MVDSWSDEGSSLSAGKVERAKVRLLIEFFVWLLTPHQTTHHS